MMIILKDIYSASPVPGSASACTWWLPGQACPALFTSSAMFAAVYPDGDPAHALAGVSTYEYRPGQGVVFDVIIPQAGNYPFVDHSMRNMQMGAVGVLAVTE